MNDCMTQEDAEKMDNRQAVEILKPLRDMMRDQHGCPISDAFFALNKAIEALSAQQWIPVTEQLPEKHEEVLVTVAGEIVIAWLYLDGRWRSNDCPEAYLNDHITAWRELPEPYREETEDG